MSDMAPDGALELDADDGEALLSLITDAYHLALRCGEARLAGEMFDFARSHLYAELPRPLPEGGVTP